MMARTIMGINFSSRWHAEYHMYKYMARTVYFLSYDKFICFRIRSKGSKGRRFIYYALGWGTREDCDWHRYYRTLRDSQEITS